jgi:Transcription factor TFIID complex subunit 8 C-term
VPGEPVVFDTGDISDPEPAFEADEVPYIPQTFRGPPFSHYLPPLPAKHTYLCSPPSPPQRSTLSLSVEKKLQNTAQVRSALKSLMDATDEPAEPTTSPPAAAAPFSVTAPASDDNGGPQEQEGVAPTATSTTASPTSAPVIPPRSYKLKQANIVNWQESFAMTRKRWKVTAH